MGVIAGFVFGAVFVLLVWLDRETRRCARSGFTGSCWCTCGKRKEPR